MDVTQLQSALPLFEGLAVHPWLAEQTQQAYVGDEAEIENDYCEHHTWPLAACSTRCSIGELSEENALFNKVGSLSRSSDASNSTRHLLATSRHLLQNCIAVLLQDDAQSMSLGLLSGIPGSIRCTMPRIRQGEAEAPISTSGLQRGWQC